jgi:hypothetical protein
MQEVALAMVLIFPLSVEPAIEDLPAHHLIQA